MRRLPRAGRDARGATHSDHIGVFRQRQPGLNYVGLKTPVGRVTADQLDELARLADAYGQGELRFTPSQDVLLPHVPDARLGDLTQEPLLKELPYNPSEMRRGLVSCTGTDFCNLALIDTKTRAMALARDFEKHVGKTRPITVRWSGCPASCGESPHRGHRAPGMQGEGGRQGRGRRPRLRGRAGRPRSARGHAHHGRRAVR